ncbi:MAG: hypothetical protein GQ578_01780 [Desulfuromonadaceae bacterium]|nr:hypothetical protein [Desulfuromonadaceae bacterium]
MDEKLLHILQHSLGVDMYGQGEQYRNHFAAYPGGKDFESCSRLAEMGLMRDMGTRSFTGDMHCFIVAPEGIDAIAQHSPSPPKLTRGQQRYQRYLEYGDMFESFLDFCRWDGESERSWNA